MKKLKKRLLSTLFLSVFIFSISSTPIVAAVSTSPFIPIKSEEELYYIISCPSGDKHQMSGRYMGGVYAGPFSNPGERLLWGTASQCNVCHLLLITENNPFIPNINCWGKYATWDIGYYMAIPVNIYDATLLTSDSRDNPFALGFEFLPT